MASKKIKITDTKQYDKYKKSVENFAPLIDYIESSNIKKSSKITQITHLTLFCCSQDKYIYDLLNEAKREEKSDKPLDERKIGKRLEKFEQYLKDAGYANKTVYSRVKTVRTFYRREGITLPSHDLRPMINPKLREEIKNSDVFKNFVVERNLTNSNTIGGYLTCLTGYCDYYNMSIEELIEEAENEEVARVRLGKRKVKKRLIEYRNHLYDKKFSNKTVKSKMTLITYFYVINDIEIPQLPKVTTPYDRSISFDEVPKKEHVKKAIETTTSIKNRAMFFFCMTSLSGSAEVREFTVEEYIRGIKAIPDHEDISGVDIEKTLDEVEKELNEALKTPQNQNESIIPVFHIVRKKKKRDYFTCITPEANSYILNYLKTREGLTLEDKVFDYSRKSLQRAFSTVNDKNNWGWINRDRQRFFTSHQLRRLGANLIEDKRLADEISGRKFDETTEAYFKRDKKKIRKEYFKWLDELTIYQKYRIKFMTDERYAAFAQELQAEKKEKEQYKKELAELKQQINQTQEQMDETNKAIEKLQHKRENPKIKNIITNYFIKNYRDDIIKEEYKKDKENYIGLEKCTVIRELAYEFALENKSEFRADTEYLDKLIKKAKVKCSFNPDMILEKYAEIHERNIDLYEVNTTMSNLVKDIIIIIGNNKDAWELVNQDQNALKNTIIKHIKNSKYNINDITAEEEKQIAEDVMMEFIDIL
ncbi:hypothetical protein [uncultured Methanobrevibacter sp.]|uniref:hypothetical protein n=1 Tax=uncultured Methanobrevibacter sp. TaxID=253161 RepID=UPI003207AA51